MREEESSTQPAGCSTGSLPAGEPIARPTSDRILTTTPSPRRPPGGSRLPAHPRLPCPRGTSPARAGEHSPSSRCPSIADERAGRTRPVGGGLGRTVRSATTVRAGTTSPGSDDPSAPKVTRLVTLPQSGTFSPTVTDINSERRIWWSVISPRTLAHCPDRSKWMQPPAAAGTVWRRRRPPTLIDGQSDRCRQGHLSVCTQMVGAGTPQIAR
jgi:hypothetical protein